jgi:hypothetical protein
LLLQHACAAYAAAVRSERQFYSGDVGVGLRYQTELTHAQQGSLRALDALAALLWERRRLPRITRASSRSRGQPRYAAVEARLSSRAADVRCWSRDDWRRVLHEEAAIQDLRSVDADGFASFEGRTVNLSPDVCSGLDALAYGSRPRDVDEVAYGVFVLAHESEHIAGVDDEALATCNGLQHVEGAARLLGAGRAYARRLALAYWRDIYPDEPPDYRAEQCGPDRPLDLSPGDGRWP